MLSKTNRFHGHNAVRHVYRQGKTTRTPLIALKFSLNERRRNYRVAVVVSKKVNKSAVVRNRIRRRVYEVVRAQIPADFDAYDLVFTVFDEKVAELSAKELQKNIESLLEPVLKK